MLQTISWSEFLTALAILTGGYYLVSSLLFYSNELSSWLKQKKQTPLIIESSTNISEGSEEVIGATRSSESFNVSREVNSSGEGLRVAPVKEVESDHDDSESLLVGTVSDLLHEIKSLGGKIVAGNKEESIPLFRELLSRYPQLVDTQYQEAINLFIINTSQESGSWEFDAHEVVTLWPLTNR